MNVTKPLMPPRADLTPDEHLLIPKINTAYHFGELAAEVQLDITEGRKVLLTGHMGCGKTSLYEQFAAQISQPVMRVNMNGQTTIADFVGFWTAKGGETIWVDGALPLAMRRGYWLIVDEIDFAEASILSVLNSVAEKDGKLFLKEKGHEIIIPHKNFRLLATANTAGCMEHARHIYQGANQMNRALLDRFRVYHVDYLKSTAEAQVLANTVENLPQQAAQVLVKLANEVRKAFNEEELASTFSLRQLIDFAELMTRKKEKDKTGKKDPNVIIMESAEVVIYSKISKEDADVVRGMVQRVLMKKQP
jgi:cobaltochelatase CobS